MTEREKTRPYPAAYTHIGHIRECPSCPCYTSIKKTVYWVKENAKFKPGFVGAIFFYIIFHTLHANIQAAFHLIVNNICFTVVQIHLQQVYKMADLAKTHLVK